MEVTRATAFHLPDGGRIEISTENGKYLDSANPDRYWNTMDITRITPDGKAGVICAIDFDSENGLSLKVYDEKSPNPILLRTIP